MRNLVSYLAVVCVVIFVCCSWVDSASVERAKRQHQTYPATGYNGNYVPQSYQDPVAWPGVDIVRSAIDWMKTLLREMGWKPSWSPTVWQDSANRLINQMWYGETVNEAHARQSGHFFITTPSPYGPNPGSRGAAGVNVNPNGVIPPVPRHPSQRPTNWNETVSDIFEVVDQELRQEAV